MPKLTAQNHVEFDDPPAPAGRLALTSANQVEYDDAPAAPAPVSKLESALRGARAGATFGFGDELTGLLEHVLTGKEYAKARDESRAADKAAKEANPGTFLAGEIGGGLATAVIPGGGIVKGAGLAANIARGAGAGIAAGIGNSESDLTQGDVAGVAKDAAIGGLTGGAVGGVVGTVANKLVSGATSRADKTLMSDLTQRANKGVRDKVADIAPIVRDTARMHGIDKVAQDAGEQVATTSPIRKAIGARIGETYKAVDKHFIGADVDDAVAAVKAVKARYATPADVGVRKQIDAEAEAIRKMWGKQDRVPLGKLNEYIGKLEGKGFASADLTPAAGAQLKRDLAGNLEGVLQKRFAEIQEHAANIASTPHVNARAGFAEATEAADALKALPQLNQQYRALKLIEKAGKQRERLDQFKPTGLRSFTLRGLGEKAYDSTVGQVQRPLDKSLAKLQAAAAGGDKTAEMVVRALTKSAPNALSANASDVPGGVLSAATSPLTPDDQPY